MIENIGQMWGENPLDHLFMFSQIGISFLEVNLEIYVKFNPRNFVI